MLKKDKPHVEWVSRVVARMDRASNKLPEPHWLRGKWPPWVTNVARELSKAMFPTAKLEASRNWTAGEVGSILGQNLAYAAYDFSPELEVISKEKAPLKGRQSKDERKMVKLAREFLGRYEKEFIPDLLRALRFAFGLAVIQDYHECSRFFAAFGRAIQRKPSTAGDIGRTNTQIYIFFLIFWRAVEKLTSVRELHTVLCRIFGSHVVGDLKRVEKICQRLELRFARPGRPKKAKIQTV